eukprot:c6074_g1_i2.p1 GENE.c6074_g1_i2~~c6074_g1_i2.p1  ORF type:complete len:105 (+),score=12.89 c6074_g1_i2:149-463(+)
MISRRVATPGAERRASPRDRSSPFVRDNPLASASPKMLNRESSRENISSDKQVFSSKKYHVASGMSRMKEMSYEDSSGGEEESEEEDEPAKPKETRTKDEKDEK